MKNLHQLLRLASTTTCLVLLLFIITYSFGEITTARHLRTIDQAIHWLQSNGYRVCRDIDHHHNHLFAGIVADITAPASPIVVPHCAVADISYERYLVEDKIATEDLEDESSAFLIALLNLIAALTCVTVAALASGLTLGMLGLDPLMLLIKQRAGESSEERKMAADLLPIVKQHHLLLVTLLLMNACSNEALPIFLEALVPSSVAILLSVTLVLFFGEIIPSAIFTGPDQLKIASRLSPMVKVCMWLLYPIAGPIAKLLDYILHDDDDYEAYNRGELSALIRIQYEERLVAKRKRKKERAKARMVAAAIMEQQSSSEATPLAATSSSRIEGDNNSNEQHQLHNNNSNRKSPWGMFAHWFGRKQKRIHSDAEAVEIKDSLACTLPEETPAIAAAEEADAEQEIKRNKSSTVEAGAALLKNSSIRTPSIGALNFDPSDGHALAKLIEKEVDMRAVKHQMEYIADHQQPQLQQQQQQQNAHQDRREQLGRMISWGAVSFKKPDTDVVDALHTRLHAHERSLSPSEFHSLEGDDDITQWTGHVSSDSLHYDEVLMMEGVLTMKTKLAMDLMRPKRFTYRLPHDLILDEHNLIDIYSSGFSRVPVYYRNDSVEKETDALTAQDAIIGVLITKQLILVKPDDCRALHTLPLYIPNVVGPQTRLVDLLNELQTGGSRMRGGHMALVCANVEEATTALDRGEPIPSTCGWMGIITLEDVIEALLQEEIYDEYDKAQYKEQKLGKMVLAAWNAYKLEKNLKALCETSRQIKQLMTTDAVSTETTALLSNIII